MAEGLAGDGVGGEVVGAGIKRGSEAGGAGAAGVEDGGVIAGEEDGSLVVVADGLIDIEFLAEIGGELVGTLGSGEEIAEGNEGGERTLVGDAFKGEELVTGGGGKPLDAGFEGIGKENIAMLEGGGEIGEIGGIGEEPEGGLAGGERAGVVGLGLGGGQRRGLGGFTAKDAEDGDEEEEAAGDLRGGHGG